VVKTTTTRSAWVTLVNPDGRRFIAEDAYHSVLTAAILAQGGLAYALFDEAARASAPPDPAYGDVLTTGGTSDPQEPGAVLRAGSIAELAAALGMDPGLLAHTAAAVNGDVRHGVDGVFGKDPALLRPIATPPFYAVAVRPALVAVTGYGLRIDEQARVLDHADAPIPGLFAAGEATGNVLGELYIGSGNSLTSCFVFGRMAGTHAQESARRHG
jgi:fumarate reductase flavoprotein subunit